MVAMASQVRRLAPKYFVPDPKLFGFPSNLTIALCVFIFFLKCGGPSCYYQRNWDSVAPLLL